jgi:hypothetical protein
VGHPVGEWFNFFDQIKLSQLGNNFFSRFSNLEAIKFCASINNFSHLINYFNHRQCGLGAFKKDANDSSAWIGQDRSAALQKRPNAGIHGGINMSEKTVLVS